jgi:flagellar FliJ protein
MKRFHFPLRPVVVVRSHRESRAREALADAIREGVRCDERLSAARGRVAEAATVIAASRRGRVSARDEIGFGQMFRRECGAEAEAQKQAAAAQALIAQRREAYLESRRQVKIVTKLEERARAEHRLACLRAEQIEIDEIANRRKPLREQNL